jgi:serine/threonine protein kinase
MPPGIKAINLITAAGRRNILTVRKLGSYDLFECIGAGGMAEVWLARRRTLAASKTVAIKLLAPNLAKKQQYRDLFLKEARLSMLLSNSNIVQVFDFGEESGDCFMAMEYIDGANLAEIEAALWQAGSGIPLDIALYITGEVLRALDYAHTLVHGGAATIVHRDISPANILLSLAGEVKLTDFGVARFGTEETSGINIKGKLRYMPPEQLDGNSKEGTVDLYAVGVMLHEMLDGRKFREGVKDDMQLCRMTLQGVMPELADPTRAPEEVDALRRRLLEPDVARRVGSARDALQLLRACPGYKNAALELQTIVRWYRSLQPGDPGYRERRIIQPIENPPDEQVADTSVSHPNVLATGAASKLRITRRQQLLAAFLLLLGGLIVGCAGVMFAIGDLDAAPVAETRTKPFEPVEMAPTPASPEPEPNPKPDERAAGPVIQEEELKQERNVHPVLEPVLEPEPEPEPAPDPTPKAELVTVEFNAGKLRFAYVKVGGKRLTADPRAKTKLSPGSHAVYVRFNNNSKWVKTGRVEVRSGRPCLVELLAPSGVQVKPRK